MSAIEYATFEYGGQPCDATAAHYEGMLDLNGPVKSVQNVRITGSSTYGVRISEDAKLARFSHNTFARNAKASILVHAPALLHIGAPNTFETPLDYIEIDSTFALDEKGSWKAQDVPFRARRVELREHADVSIEAGTRIQLSGGSFDVGAGSLNVQGTGDKAVVFTSAVATPLAGDWGCLQLGSSPGASRIDHAVIEYGGGGQGCTAASYKSALIARASTHITNSVFNNLAGPAIETRDECNKAEWCANTFTAVSGTALLCTIGDTPTACP